MSELNVSQLTDYYKLFDDGLRSTLSFHVANFLNNMAQGVTNGSSQAMQQELDQLANMIILSPEWSQNECLLVIQRFLDNAIRQRACLALLTALCKNWSVVNSADILQKLNEMVFPTIEHLGWDGLFGRWGEVTIRNIANAINQLNSHGALTGSCRSLCKQLGMALFENGRDVFRPIKSQLEALLFPGQAQISRVQAVSKRFDASVDTINSASDFDAMIEEMLSELTPPSGEMLELSSHQKQHLTRSWQDMKNGLKLLSPDLFSNELRVVSLDYIKEFTYINIIRSLADLEWSPSDILGRFSAFYLLDSFAAALKDFYPNGLDSSTAVNIFLHLAKATFSVMKINGSRFLRRMEEGQRCSDAVYATSRIADTEYLRNISETLFFEVQKEVVQQLASLSESEVVPIQLGWNDRKGGHAMWGILFQRQVRILNTGCGLNYHRSTNSPSGVGRVFQISKISRVFGEVEFQNYLMQTLALQRSDWLQILTKMSHLPDTSRSRAKVALLVHYYYLGDGGSEDIWTNGQKSITCSTKILKILFRSLSPERYSDFRAISSMLAFTTWYSRIEKVGRQAELKMALKHILAKEVFSRLEYKPLVLKEEIARHLIVSWQWQCVPILKSIYSDYLNDSCYSDAKNWLAYLYGQNSSLGIQCTAETIDRHVDGQLPLQAVIKALEVLIDNSICDPETYYKLFEERCTKLDDFPWGDLVRRAGDVAYSLLEQMRLSGFCLLSQRKMKDLMH